MNKVVKFSEAKIPSTGIFTQQVSELEFLKISLLLRRKICGNFVKERNFHGRYKFTLSQKPTILFWTRSFWCQIIVLAYAESRQREQKNVFFSKFEHVNPLIVFWVIFPFSEKSKNLQKIIEFYIFQVFKVQEIKSWQNFYYLHIFKSFSILMTVIKSFRTTFFNFIRQFSMSLNILLNMKWHIFWFSEIIFFFQKFSLIDLCNKNNCIKHFSWK